MKVKELIAILKDLNPDAKVLVGRDYELNQLYPKVFVEVLEFHKGEFKGNLELNADNVANIETIVISGQGEYLLESE